MRGISAPSAGDSPPPHVPLSNQKDERNSLLLRFFPSLAAIIPHARWSPVLPSSAVPRPAVSRSTAEAMSPK